MNNKNFGLMLFALLVLLTVIIFYFSSQPPSISNSQSGLIVKIIGKINDTFDITDTNIYTKIERMVKDIWFLKGYKTTNAVVRKSAHFGIYFILGILSSSFGYIYSRKMFIGFLLGISFPVTIAVLDEYNQGFIGRTSSLKDVIIDGSGAFTGTVLVILFIMLIQLIKILRNRESKIEKSGKK